MISEAHAVLRWLLTALCLSACASSVETTSIDSENMSSPWRHWQTEGPPKAAILALHGFNDYSNAFQDFATFASERGVAVHAYDQRGFGGNADAGLWAGTERLTGDLRHAIDELRTIYPTTRLYVLGESMGGAVTIVTATQGERLPVDGLILVAPAIWGGDQLNLFYRATLWLASTVAPGWKLTGSGLEIWPSDNVEMLKAFSADPLVIKGTRTDAVAGLVALMDEALASLKDLDQEVLVLTGIKDQVVPPGAFASMRERLSETRCQEIIYPDGYHMLLRDLQRETVYNDVMAWIGDKTLRSKPPLTCGPEKNISSAQND
ncbi:MAG: lysophospholipase [Geminicoccales bacterium]